MDEREFMQSAIDAAREGIAAGQSPFGASIIRGGELVVAAHNRVWLQSDPSAHGEVQAIRQACDKLQTIDLSACEIYTTCEPCPMCFAAIHWAKIPKIIYGTSIADSQRAGFCELTISNEQMKSLGNSNVEIVAGFMRGPCLALFDEWLAREDHRAY